MEQRPTLGMFINWLTGMHEQQWLGVVDAARAHGANLICFSGKELEHPDHFYSHAGVVFDLVSPSHIDGLIIWSATLQHFVGNEKMAAFCRRFEPLPMVSVEQQMPGMGCVLADDQRGMYEVVRHLIETHGHRRIAFVRGPANHPGARLRYTGYVQALTEHGLAVDPALVTPPLRYWMPEEAAQAAAELLDRHGGRIDAIAAANDDLALGVIWMLQRRGLHVPADIAVVGFDDAINIQRPDLGMDLLRNEDEAETPHIYSSATMSVSLTTARSPTYQLGWGAVEALLAQLRGEPVQPQTTIAAPLVQRRSCGCLPGGATPEAPDAREALQVAPAAASSGSLAAQLASLLDGAMSASVESRAKQLLDRFVDAASGAPPGAFLFGLDELVRASVRTQDDLTPWWPVLRALRSEALARDPGIRGARLSALMERTQTLMWEWTGHLHEYERALAGKQQQIVREVGQKLITALDLDQIAQVLVDELPNVGLSSCTLALYEPGDPSGAYPTPLSRAVLVYDRGRRVDPSPGGELFASSQLVPRGVGGAGEPRSLVVLPLYFHDRQLGFVTLEGRLREGWVYEALRAQLSSAVQGALLVERERHALAEAEEARARAEVASLARSTFLSTMSHELRTPLNGILGYAQILQFAGGLTPQQTRGLQTIRSSGEHLLTLINDILDLAKIDAARLDLAPEVVRLGDFIRVISDIIRVKCDEKDLLFECETRNLPDTVRIDDKRLRQVLLNLLANAVKFTDRGAVRLRVIGSEAREDVVPLRFEVADTGIGIAPQHRERVFQPFEQVSEPGRRAAGTGLGLSISRQLVRLMGGDIQVNSEVGRGSVFSFEISVPVVNVAGERSRAAVAGRIAGYRGRRRRLLIVDDGDANRTLLADYLRPLGFRTDEARSGEEAVERVRAAPPDLVLMDCVMPVMDGLEATRRIRTMPGLRQPPIVVVSANASPDNRERCLVAGADAFMCKPVDRNQLLEEVGRQLELEWVTVASDEPAARPQ